MKDIVWLFLLVFSCFSCSTESKIEIEENKDLLLLQVDYLTNKFEGGYALQVAQGISDTDSLLIEADYQPPGDFGNISLYLQPKDQLIFDASIIWMGTGKIKYPTDFIPAEDFSKSTSPAQQPPDSTFQFIFQQSTEESANYDQIWKALENLKIVSEFRTRGREIGVFLYTPSVGVGNKAEWDWFVIMQK